jgi:hypothetical protein
VIGREVGVFVLYIQTTSRAMSKLINHSRL